MSNLSAIEYVTSPSALTTGLLNQRYSVISANFAALNSDVTLTLSSMDTFSLLSNLSISNRLAVGEKIHIGPAVSASTNRTALLTLVGNMSNAGSGGTDYIYFNDSSAGKTSWLIGSGVGDASDSLTFFNLSQGTPVIKLLPTAVQIGGGTPTTGAVSINQKNNQAGIVINQGSDVGSYGLLIQNGVVIGDVNTPQMLLLSQWASSNTSQVAIRVNVTNTASHISSLLLSLEADSIERFGVAVDGTVRSMGSLAHWRFTEGTFSVDPTLDPAFYLAPAARVNPVQSSEALYVQHRVSNNVSGNQVHDAFATEIDLSSVTNTGSAFLNALETSVVFTGGGSLVSDTRGLTSNLVVNSGVTGTVDNISLLRAQTKGALPGGFSIGTFASLWLEAQTVATNNYTLYGPAGIARLGTVQVVGTGSRGRLYLDGTGGVDTSILGFSLSSVTQFQIQHDNTNAKLYIIASGGTGLGIDATGAVHIAGKLGTSSGNTVSHGTYTTLAGNTFVDGAGNFFALTAPAGNARDVRVFSGAAGSASTLRWLLRFDGTAEGGSNTGTDFTLLARDDSGGAIGTAFKIVRSTMQAAFASSVSATALIANPGSALAPTFNFVSESSLGWYRSAASTMALSYGTIVAPEHWATSGISVGNATAGGSLIPAISSTSSLVAAFVVQGSASSFTVITWAAVQPGDQILTTIKPDAAVSSMSSGLIAHSHCTKAGQFEFRLSNVSTLQQNQSSKTWYFTRISPF